MKKRKEFAQRSDTSFKNLSSNSIHSTDSEKEITTKVREGTGINRDAQRLLVEQEQANPGVSKTGWLEAFMKNDVLEKYKRSPFSSKKNVNEGVKPSSKKRMSVTILYEPSSAVAQTLMLIDRFDLNLLEVDKDHLIPLAKTMLLKLRFSKEIKLEDELLDNFLRELSTKYGKYGNPFHNFIHGVNGTIRLIQSCICAICFPTSIGTGSISATSTSLHSSSVGYVMMLVIPAAPTNSR